MFDKDRAFWERARELQRENRVLTAVVTFVNTGGLVVRCEGMNGFLPFRLLGRELGQAAEQLRGQELPVKIVEVNVVKRELVLRHCAAAAASLQDAAVWERARQLQDEGAVLTATITSVNRGGVEAECEGYRGFIPFRLLGEELGRDADALLGKEVPVRIVEVNEERGELMLRHQGAASAASPDGQQDDAFWERAERWQEEGAVVTAVVTSLTKGGAVVELEGHEGFVPFSLLGRELGRDAEALRGQEIPVKVEKARKAKGDLLLRHWPYGPETSPEKFLESLRENQLVEGTVQAVQPYGAFVDLGCGVTGLLHVTDYSHDRVRRLPDVLPEGERLRALVGSKDQQRGRISLSTKWLEPTPGDMLRDRRLVYDKAEETAERRRRSLAEAAQGREGERPEERAERLRRDYDEIFQKNFEIPEFLRRGRRDARGRQGREGQRAERAEGPGAEPERTPEPAQERPDGPDEGDV